MSNSFVGEIKMFSGNFAPVGHAFCAGQLLPIDQYDALFSLLGTTYGGDGQNSFGLPDLRGRVPVGTGQGSGLGNYTLGQIGGAEEVTITTNQLPSHTHPAAAQSASGGIGAPASNTAAWAAADGNPRYSTNTPTGSLNGNSIGQAGGSQPHDNMLPFQCINYIIALEGIYPSAT